MALSGPVVTPKSLLHHLRVVCGCAVAHPEVRTDPADSSVNSRRLGRAILS